MTRICGSCTLCCKLMEISEIEKPVGEWCGFCSVGNGCRIKYHAERPKSCGEFNCLWLQGIGTEDMRPDRSKVVMSATRNGESLVLHVDPSRPEAYKAPGFYQAINRLADSGRPVFVTIGDKRKMIRSGTAGLQSQPGSHVLANRVNERKS